MNDIKNMSREELINLIEAAKAGKLKIGIKFWYFIDNELFKSTKKGLKAVNIDNFLSKVNENDIILSYAEIDLKKHPHLKDKLNIVVPDEQTAKNIEKLC